MRTLLKTNRQKPGAAHFFPGQSGKQQRLADDQTRPGARCTASPLAALTRLGDDGNDFDSWHSGLSRKSGNRNVFRPAADKGAPPPIRTTPSPFERDCQVPRFCREGFAGHPVPSGLVLDVELECGADDIQGARVSLCPDAGGVVPQDAPPCGVRWPHLKPVVLVCRVQFLDIAVRRDLFTFHLHALHLETAV